MSKKDYDAIATVLRGDLATANFNTSARAKVSGIIFSLADVFEQNNPRFDRNRFYFACGLLEDYYNA